MSELQKTQLALRSATLDLEIATSRANMYEYYYKDVKRHADFMWEANQKQQSRIEAMSKARIRSEDALNNMLEGLEKRLSTARLVIALTSALDIAVVSCLVWMLVTK